MIGFIKFLLAPFTLAWFMCAGMWDKMTDWGWNIYLRMLIAGTVFVAVAGVCTWAMGYI